MKAAHDIFAETNPAFCTLALAEFVKAYMSVNPAGPELLTIYLALPIALSGDLENAFDRTNKNTGLLEWLERQPQVRVALADRCNASLDVVTEAVRFSCFTGVLMLTADARLQIGSIKLKQRSMTMLDDAATRAVKRGRRLGYWCAMAGSTRNVFDVVGLIV